ncbi:MAG: CoA ester lyase [Ignavibacteriales bacterium]|nr:CoA ester lyase [Ignavibacteriales bacterium]
MKLRRSILSVPGHLAGMHQKAAGSSADVIMLDLEDSVPLALKEEARQQVVTSINSLDWGNKNLSIRINQPGGQFAHRDILEIIPKCGGKLNSIVIPKVSTPADVHFIDKLLEGLEAEFNLANKIALEPSIEDPLGLENVSEIAAASSRNITLVFGIADFSSSIGAKFISIYGHGENEDFYPGHRWHYVLSRMVIAGKARGLSVIDAPYGNFKDSVGLQRSAELAAALGVDGKWAIHPTQIDIINSVFSPSIEEIERAQRVMDVYKIAVAEGKGAAELDGRMIDNATLRLAKITLEKLK